MVLGNLRRLKNILLGKIPYKKIDIDLPYEYLGNDNYGSWPVIASLLNEKSIIYSFGVGKDISFDTSLIRLKDCKIYAYDPTPESIEWIQSENVPSKFIFHPYGISLKDGEIIFYKPKNIDHISHSFVKSKYVDEKKYIRVKALSIATIMKENNHQEIDILKMDIEGSEYDILSYVAENHLKFKQVLVEFHHDNGINTGRDTVEAIENLRNSGFSVFAISASGKEIGFVQNNCLSSLNLKQT